jgi:hypothetical protein
LVEVSVSSMNEDQSISAHAAPRRSEIRPIRLGRPNAF